MARGIQSIEIGYRILTAIQQGPGAVALKDIAARADIAASAAHNYLTSYQRTGMVAPAGRGLYKLGPSLAALGITAARDVDHFELVRNRAIELAETTGLGAAVLTWQERGPLIIFNKPDVASRTFGLYSGPVRMIETAGGRLFAAHLPMETVIPVAMAELGLAKNERAKAKAWLDENAARVREAGFGESDLKSLKGYKAISAPIWNAQGEMAYALTLTAPKSLVDTSDVGEHVPPLSRAAAELSRMLGAPPVFWAPAAGGAG